MSLPATDGSRLVRIAASGLGWFGCAATTLLGAALGPIACYNDPCPVDTDRYWIERGLPGEIFQTTNTPEALVGATLTADGEHLVIEYTDPERGPVRVTYRMSNPRRVE